MHYSDIKLNGIDENGEEKKYKLKDLNDKTIILYFYPQDDTPVCTQEAKNFRDAMNELKEYATIIGVSNNDIEEHKEFQKKHKLNFLMLSDREDKLKEAFKEHLTTSSNIHRSTFILDNKGKIIKSWEKVDIDDHIEDIIKFFKNKDIS